MFKDTKILVVGNGYLGNRFSEHFHAPLCQERITLESDALNMLDYYCPNILINCIGKTGSPNVDWCENHRAETFFANVVVPHFLATACANRNVNLVHLSSGCIYSGDNGGRGFSEYDEPNFAGSYYSLTKQISEKILNYEDVLQIRIRMPIDSRPHPRNLLTKLLGYHSIIESPNSITPIPELLRITEELIRRQAKGIFNVVADQSITHSVILNIYAQYHLPHKYILISPSALDTLAPRSNCVLSTEKLKKMGISPRNSADCVAECCSEYIVTSCR